MKKGIWGMVLLLAFVVSASAVYAEVVHVYGKGVRAEAVSRYLNSHGAMAISHPTKEIAGSLNGRPWPGVNVTTSSNEDGAQGVFVPVSNEAVRSGLCADQKRLLQSYLPTAKSYQPTATVQPPVANGMRVIASGDKCDEISFSGMVPQGVLDSTRGHGADAIEVHQRPDKSLAFKAKRGRVLSDGIFYPLVWVRDGSCVRTYANRPLSAADLQTLLLPAESVALTQVTDIGKKQFGRHMTESVYVINGSK